MAVGEETPKEATKGAVWRAARNARSLARLERAMPAIFPAPVRRHALSRPLIPPTPRLAVESYWRDHVLRAERLARALAARSGTPEGWTWADDAASFRLPPAPFREPAHARGPGHCCVCGQPVFRLGWHADLWGEGRPNVRATWHAACVTAWKFWIAPAEQAPLLKRRQGHRCALSGKRLLRGAQIDHRLPLYRVWREHRDRPWPELLAFWGAPNLAAVNRGAHVVKCGAEALERAARRRGAAGAGDLTPA